MRLISATELELLTFFEVEPTSNDLDSPWPYNDWLYRVSVAGIDVSFSVAPAYRDVHLIVRCGETTFYELKSLSIDDVLFHDHGDREVLELRLVPRDRLFLRLRPAVQLVHEIAEFE